MVLRAISLSVPAVMRLYNPLLIFSCLIDRSIESKALHFA